MSDQARSNELRVSRAELIGLFLLLKRHESELDAHQSALYDRVLSKLYTTMSVADMEDVESYYNAL